MESLRHRIREGDADAFGELFDAHVQVVYAYAARWTGNRAAAEDVVSLVFLEAWRLRDRLHPDGDSLLPWLLGIATNVLRHTSRTARRHRAAMDRLPPRQAQPDFAEDLVTRLDDGQRLAAAQRALPGLRHREREVFMLCVWAGVGYAQAAEALGIPVGTVRSRLSRARSRLRELTEMELSRATGQVQVRRQVASRSR